MERKSPDMARRDLTVARLQLSDTYARLQRIQNPAQVPAAERAILNALKNLQYAIQVVAASNSMAPEYRSELSELFKRYSDIEKRIKG